MSKRFPLTFIVVLIAAMIWSIPFWWVLSLSFQPNDILQKTTSNTAMGFIPLPFTLENYYLIWGQSFFDWFINSAIIAVTMTVFATILCSLSGYAFARIDFVGKKIIYPIVLAGLMIPGELLFIPLFTQFSSLGLNNSFTGLILPRLAVPFGVFIMTQYYKGVPNEVEEAAIARYLAEQNVDSAQTDVPPEVGHTGGRTQTPGNKSNASSIREVTERLLKEGLF